METPLNFTLGGLGRGHKNSRRIGQTGVDSNIQRAERYPRVQVRYFVHATCSKAGLWRCGPAELASRWIEACCEYLSSHLYLLANDSVLLGLWAYSVACTWPSGLMPSLEVVNRKIISLSWSSCFSFQRVICKIQCYKWGTETCLSCPTGLYEMTQIFPFSFSVGQFGMRGL